MTYFSIDYRSPSSGVGQIVFPRRPYADQMILVTAGDDGPEINPHYKETVYFPHNLWEEHTRSKARKFFESLFEKHGVNHVYDSELNYKGDTPSDLGNGQYSTELWLNTLFC